MNRSYYVNYLKDFPEYKWVLCIHLRTAQVYELYKTKREALLRKKMEEFSSTIMRREEFIKTYGGC
jgi:hypothetical protein